LSSARDKCRVVPNCINVERLKASPEVEAKAAEIRGQNKGKIICLAVGRHTEYKGFKYLIRAAHLLDDRFQIYITGKGEETDNLKAEAGNDLKIHFLGLVDDLELKGYLTAMDIFCFPSITKNEAFGLALAEGMYYGKPAVTFTIPGSGVNYVNLDGVTGIEVPNRDINAYAKAMKKLADNPKLRGEYGEAGRKRVEDNFLNAQFRENILRVIDELK
jgi:N-acetyllactosaminide 3-alpha-galactosyltransferase/rhamnosyl/mannosyltransferase